MIQTCTGSLSDSKSLKNWLVLKRDLPADDFEIVVEASIQIQAVGNYLSMALFQNDQNYFAIQFQGDSWGNNIRRGPHFYKVLEGKTTEFGGQEKGFGLAVHAEHIYMKIERQEDNYSAFYAYVDKPAKADEIQWVKMGTLPWINFNGKLALLAANYQDGPEISAGFHSVVIRNK